MNKNIKDANNIASTDTSDNPDAACPRRLVGSSAVPLRLQRVADGVKGVFG